MTIDQASPPRLAQLLLHVALPAPHADPVLGDLLEEYRAVRRPSRGRLGADAWYDFAMFAMVATIMFPTLPAVVWQKPFIIVIGATFLVMALTFAVAIGAIGAVAGRRNSRPPDTCVEHAFEQSSGGSR